MLEPGALLAGGRYMVLRLIDRGGMGCVYQAIQPSLGDRLVAVKEMDVPLSDPAERQQALDHFKREATMLASLEHPGLVQVADCFEEAGTAYLVMSYVDGVTLAQAMEQEAGFLPVDRVVGWAEQVADVLSYLHQRTPPIIFRDLKPRNVMVDRQGRVKLIDFGIARLFDAQNVTSTFIRGAGTPGFAPIEQYTGGRTDARTDVYSLGATLYALLTRTAPPLSVARLAGEAHLEPPRTVNPAIPPVLETAILRMMAIQRDDRYSSVAEVQRALHGFNDATAPVSTPLIPREPPTTRAEAPAQPFWRTAVRQAAEGGLGTALIGLATLLFIGAVVGIYDLGAILLFTLKAGAVSVAAGILSHLLERALLGSLGHSLVRQLMAAIVASVVAGALACALAGDPDWLIIGPAASGLGGLFSAVLSRANGRVAAAGLMGGLIGTWMWHAYPLWWLNGGMAYLHLHAMTHSDWGIALPMCGAFVGVVIGMFQPSTSGGTRG